MGWSISFISEENFTNHVKLTIEKYGEKLESYDIVKFNKNIIDPIKLIFDKNVYQASWDEIIKNEIFRQRDKSNNNDIGYFHQRLFQYFTDCHVPDNGKEGGWDVILNRTSGVKMPEGDVVHKVYVEMKNKHNTMNAPASAKTYIKMQNQLLADDDCACFLVEAIAKKSQNIKWSTTVDGKSVSHKRIRRVSIDQFYAIVTGEEDAYLQICMALPEIIKKVVTDSTDGVSVPHDSVIQELKNIAYKINKTVDDLSMAMAIYLLGFSTYNGFKKVSGIDLDDEKGLRILYEYAKMIDEKNGL